MVHPKKTLETAHTISYDYLCPGGRDIMTAVPLQR